MARKKKRRKPLYVRPRGQAKAEKLLREFGVDRVFDGWTLANWGQPDDDAWSPECKRRAEYLDIAEMLAFPLRCRGTTRAYAIRQMRNFVLNSTLAPYLPDDWQDRAGQAEIEAGDALI